MGDTKRFDLTSFFQASLDALRQNRQSLNQADTINGNHGDHMVEIFQVAVEAAQAKWSDTLPEAMAYASERLYQIVDNGSAHVYARGLSELAEQFRKHQVTLDNLAPYVRGLLGEEQGTDEVPEQMPGDILKALVAGLAGWNQEESEGTGQSHPLNMGNLFEFGIAYLQAKQRGGSKAEVLANAAVSASPLGGIPHRRESGRLAIQSFLQAMQSQDYFLG